jgi:hypothetical protein
MYRSAIYQKSSRARSVKKTKGFVASSLVGGFLLQLPAHVIEPISGEPRAALSRSRLLFLMGNIAPAVNRTVEALTSRSTSCKFPKIRLQILNSLPSFKTPRWPPFLWDVNRMQPTMHSATTTEELIRSRFESAMRKMAWQAGRPSSRRADG